MSPDSHLPDVHTTSEPTSGHLVSEIAHVLFLDIVGFSKRRPSIQRQILEALVKIVINSAAFQQARASDELITLPTGDGMALVFLNKHEGSGPATSCAEQIAVDIAKHNEGCRAELGIDVRMGLHSGTVIRIDDINEHPNVAGEGINTAQRVMDCGDARHILLSSIAKHLLPAEPDRSDQLKGLGEVRVKHDQRVELFNLTHDAVGRSEIPQRILEQRAEEIQRKKEEERLQEIVKEVQRVEQQKRRRVRIAASVLMLVTVVVAGGIVWWKMQAPAAPPTLAILQFKPGSNKGTSQLISSGLMEQLKRNLDDYADLKPQSEVSAALGAGRDGQQEPLRPEVVEKLKVRYVLLGSADARTENELENFDTPNTEFLVDVHLELYEVGKEKPLLQKDYSGAQFKELMLLPRKFAAEAAEVMGVSVQKKDSKDTDKLYAKDAKAFWHYLQGRYWWSVRPTIEADREAVKKVTENAIKSYQAAIKSDPGYSLAHSGLADVYISIGGLTDDPIQSKNAALAAATAALDSEPELAPAYASIGMVKCWFERDFLAAKIAFLGAIARNDKYVNSYRWYSACLNNFGKIGEAEQVILEAKKLEPNNLIVHVTHAQNYYFSGQTPKAIALLTDVLSQRTDMSVANRFLALAYEQDKQWDKALEFIQKAAGRRNDNDDSDVLGARGHILASMRNYRDALAAAQRLEYLRGEKKIYVSPYNIALVYAEIPGREDKAFELLDAAIREGDPRISWLKVDPRFVTLRQAREKDFDARLRDARLGDS